jgi:thioredoxin 1
MKIVSFLIGLLILSKAIAAEPAKPAGLPKLVDLGAGKCIPCRMMKPILDELVRDYAA